MNTLYIVQNTTKDRIQTGSEPRPRRCLCLCLCFGLSLLYKGLLLSLLVWLSLFPVSLSWKYILLSSGFVFVCYVVIWLSLAHFENDISDIDIQRVRLRPNASALQFGTWKRMADRVPDNSACTGRFPRHCTRPRR